MKKKLIISTISLLAFGAAQAADGQAPQTAVTFADILIGIVTILALFVIVMMIQLITSVKELKNALANPDQVKHSDVSYTAWEKFWAFKNVRTEEEIKLNEDYDGIVELDNPSPPWFNFMFYITIFVAIVYLINYHVAHYSKLSAGEYDQEMAEAKIAKDAYMKSVGSSIDENSVTLLTDATKLTEGAEIFKKNCVVCHGEKAEGKVGPNLTDEYWIHGNTIKDVFKTISNGVPEKGMVSWKSSLTPEQIQVVASYIKSLAGTNPPNPKEPQGTKMDESGAAPKDSVSSTPLDTTKK